MKDQELPISHSQYQILLTLVIEIGQNIFIRTIIWMLSGLIIAR